MSAQNALPARDMSSAAVATEEPFNLSASQASSGPPTETMTITTDPVPIDDRPRQGALRAATTTTSSDAAACASPSNAHPIQLSPKMAELVEVMGDLSLHSAAHPVAHSADHESGYEADGEKKPQRPKSKKLLRRRPRQPQRRRLYRRGGLIQRSSSAGPSSQVRSRHAARHAQNYSSSF